MSQQSAKSHISFRRNLLCASTAMKSPDLDGAGLEGWLEAVPYDKGPGYILHASLNSGAI